MRNPLYDHYIKLLRTREVIAFPTETVYGLGADARSLSAVQKVYTIKGRPADNPLIVHISSFEMLHQFAEEIPEKAKLLMKTFWPGPLTLIFKKKPDVLDAITAGLDTVAVRWPSHPIAQELISATGPLVAPSANSSGRPSPTRSQHVKEDFGDDFPVVEGGETDIGLESTVLDVSLAPLRLYRPGAISAKQIEEVIDEKVATGGNAAGGQVTRSPGTRYSHYSPKADVKWWNEEEILESDAVLYLLHTKKPEFSKAGAEVPQNIEKIALNIIHFSGDYQKMAHQLFDRFRQADRQGYTEILIEPFSAHQLQEISIVPALFNRISKAVG